MKLKCDEPLSNFAFDFNLRPYTKSVVGGSVLELLLVVAMSRLHRIRQFPSFNFNHVANEIKTMAGRGALPLTPALATASI